MSDKTLLIVCTACGTTNRMKHTQKLSRGKCGKCAVSLGSSKPVDVSDKIFAKLQSRDQGPYVLDVWAPWCGPCKMMAPAYTASAATFDGNIRFIKLNSEQYPHAAQGLNIRGIPALFLFDNGKLVSQKSGALPEEVITQWVKSDLLG